MDAHTRREWRNRFREGGFGLMVVLIVLFCTLPFIWTVITSLKTQSEIYASPATYIPRALTLDHWVDVLTLCKIFGWKDPKFAMIYYNPKPSDIAKLLG